MEYIVGALIGAAITFSCISLYFIRRAMRELEAIEKAMEKELKKFEKKEN